MRDGNHCQIIVKFNEGKTIKNKKNNSDNRNSIHYRSSSLTKTDTLPRVSNIIQLKRQNKRNLVSWLVRWLIDSRSRVIWFDLIWFNCYQNIQYNCTAIVCIGFLGYFLICKQVLSFRQKRIRLFHHNLTTVIKNIIEQTK